MDNLYKFHLEKLKPEQLKKVQKLVEKFHKENEITSLPISFVGDTSKARFDNKLFHKVDEYEVPNDQKAYYNIAKAFYDLFKNNLEEAGSITSSLEKSRYKGFVDPVRLMAEKDKVSLMQFRKVYDFLKTSDFWKKNILSTNKLRKQIPTLLIQASGESNKTANIGTGAKNITQDYIEKIKREISGDFTS